MARVPPELYAHREWLGQLQQVGLVVSPQVLVDNNVFVDRQKSIDAQVYLRALLPDPDSTSQTSRDTAIDLLALTRQVLEWPDGLLAGGPGGSPLPDTLTIALPEYNDTLSPSYAIPDPAKADEWLALISMVPAGTDLDRAPEDHGGWRAAPHARLERLLRETSVPIGLLFNGASLRLVYAPRGESSGHLTFRLAHLAETLGRPMMGALCALLDVDRVTDNSLEQQRLPYLLRESRKYQNKVSTELAGQVLEALWELLRGLQRGNEESKGALLAEVLRERPGDVYGGLLTTMMRLVFILYAEDRGLMPGSDVYQRHYSISGLFERLREDQARYPDTMDARFGAWAQLLVLFRLIHDGGGHGNLRFPSRHGRLFDPDAYPFLEGRPHESHRQLGDSVEPPMISDGVVFRVLNNLLILEGERLSYRTLDVEQIGSVYEAMMGFALQVATGPSIAVSPKHIVFNVEELLEEKTKERAAWLKEQTELTLTSDLLPKAATPSDVVGALGKRVSRYTPHVMKAGDLFLQPTEERRRSGSHYTPRSLTQPIVQTTFRPIFERLGEQATPEQILDLKVCDPAMGSGAFLVEACRLLAERLVRAWEAHKSMPKVPDEEDVLTYARRLVAERCLYGVDKNIFAVDLAKLSLWLATLAREHPFTFLDHSLRHGDTLVGLSREQIACLHWAPTKQLPLIRTFIDARVAEAQKLRLEIQSMGASDDVPAKARLLRDADEAIADVRVIGDVVVSAFFEGEKPRDRETRRTVYAGRIEAALSVGGPQTDVFLNPATLLGLLEIQARLRECARPVPAFHWEVEFPEVFTRSGCCGFDVILGNPPFLGGHRVWSVLGGAYRDYLHAVRARSGGKAVDIVAHFFRRSFELLANGGTFGLFATNTVAQGDTREAGLAPICEAGGFIYSAQRRMRWPGAAAVVVSSVNVSKGRPGTFVLNGKHVLGINSYLLASEREVAASKLRSSAEKSFRGCMVYGMGFTFDDANPDASPLTAMQDLLTRSPDNASRIFKFVGGEDINSDPVGDSSRFIINFESMTLHDAQRWPDLLKIVEIKVRPQRSKLGGYSVAEGRNERWWQYGSYTPALFRAIAPLSRCLVLSQVSPHHGLLFVPTACVFSHTAIVLALESYAAFSSLQGRIHEVWARFVGSSMKDDLRYTPSDCFDTFPFAPGWESSSPLDQVGREYYEFRAAKMVRSTEGLTKTYNRFHDPDEHDPDIRKLRELHDAMDRAVLDAYGWTDIQPTCEFILDYEDDEEDTPGKVSKRKKPWRYRWPDDLRDEVLGRLLELNAQRAKEEALAGASGAGEKSRTEVRKAATRDTPLLDR